MKFHKKPVVIEAFCLGYDPIPDWASNQTGIVYHTDHTDGGQHYAEIPTPEGTMRANVGDWIILGVKGERYPCKPDIFAATYEPVEREPIAYRDENTGKGVLIDAGDVELKA